MQSARGKPESLSALSCCLERGSRDPAALAALRSPPPVAEEAQPKSKVNRLVVVLTAGLLLLLGVGSLRSAEAGLSPFDIGDGTVPDSGAEEFSDPHGSVQELGATNGNSTKLGVIHQASPPMLDFTNANGQTDIVTIWLDTAVDSDGDTWLYFAWERDASSGSSVIAYEFQQAGLPEGCDYNTEETPPIDMELAETAGETDLIDNCNPWGLRQKDDFQVVWDFKGGATEIILRNFDGMVFDVEALDGLVSEAALNDDTSRGEGAINLTATVFADQADQCFTVGNIITGTITGNSDSADYKDTLLADFTDSFNLSNCGVVIIRKETDPDGTSGSFTFNHNLDLLPDDQSHTSFFLTDDGKQIFDNVVAPNTGYWVEEADPGTDFALPSIDCAGSDPPVTIVNRKISFDLDRGESVDCTFTNLLRPKVTVIKNVVGGDAEPNDFSLTQNGQDVDSGVTVIYDVGDTVSIDETPLEDYAFVEITGDDKCPSDLGGSTDALAASDDITCIITNAVRTGAIKIIKTRKFADSNIGDETPSGVEFVITGGSLGEEEVELETGADGEVCYDAEGAGLVFSSVAGDYTVREIVPEGYDADGDALVQAGQADQSVVYEQTVSVDEDGSCGDNEVEVTFSNTPLTNVSVTAASIDPGATKSKIECYEGTQDFSTEVITIGAALSGNSTFADSQSLGLDNQLPLWEDGVKNGLIVCTIKIDP